jgi:hypothetical protein
MSMTIDRALRRILLAAPLVALGWMAALTLPMLAGASPPAILVVLPPDDLLTRLGPDVAILAKSPVGLTLQSAEPALAQRLWAAGALVLLPAGLTGCAPVT